MPTLVPQAMVLRFLIIKQNLNMPIMMSNGLRRKLGNSFPMLILQNHMPLTFWRNFEPKLHERLLKT